VGASRVDQLTVAGLDSARPAYDVFEFGLTAERAEGFAQRFHVYDLLLPSGVRRRARFAGFLDDESFALRTVAPIFRFAFMARAAGRCRVLRFRGGAEAAVRGGVSRLRSNRTSNSMRACTSACSRLAARDRSSSVGRDR
jgi:hypothetical protein